MSSKFVVTVNAKETNDQQNAFFTLIKGKHYCFTVSNKTPPHEELLTLWDTATPPKYIGQAQVFHLYDTVDIVRCTDDNDYIETNIIYDSAVSSQDLIEAILDVH